MVDSKSLIKKAWWIFSGDYQDEYYTKIIEEQEKRNELCRAYEAEMLSKRTKKPELYEEYEDLDQEDEELTTIDMTRAEFINKVFSDIIGYENKKEIVAMAILADTPKHLLLLGKKGTGKTMFMDCLYEYFGEDKCVYAVGDSTTNAGLKQLLFEKQPRFIFIDEIDKSGYDVQESLLTLTQSGLVSEVKVSKTREMKLNCWVIVTANNREDINPKFADRCTVIDFNGYTVEQFIQISKRRIKAEKPSISRELINYTVSRMVEKNIKSVRKAIETATMAKTKQDIDLILEHTSVIEE